MHPLRLLFCSSALGCLIGLAAPLSAQTVDVWIDPGHGGKDKGNLGIIGDPAKHEKHLNLQVSNILHTRLGQLGFSSFLTRHSDIFFAKEERASMASGLRTNDADEQAVGQMFVSVHMNAARDTSVFGTETFYPTVKKYAKRLDAYRVDSTYAVAVHNNMMSQAALAFLGCSANRGVKHQRFQVIKNARIPGVLVEVCFTTNRCQQERIGIQGNQALIANGIAAGIGQVITPGGGFSPLLAERSSTGGPPLASNSTYSLLHPEPAPGVIQVLQESFESSTFPPSGWTATSQGLPAPHQWHRAVAPLYAHSGTAAARVGGESPSIIDEWLISPITSLGASDTGLMFFWIGNRFYAPDANAECLVRPSGAGQWTQLWSLQSEPEGTEFQYRERVVDISSWSGSQVQFAFRVSGINGAEFAIDDIATGSFAATAAPLNDLCSGAIAIPSGTHVFTGATCYAANNLDGSLMPDSCSADSLIGPDVFYWLSAAAGDTLNATVTGPWSPVLYLVSACNVAIGRCINATPTWQDGDISVASLQHVFAESGVYFLVVDGETGACGDYELSTRIRSSVTGVQTGEAVLPHMTGLHAQPNPSSGTVRFIGRRASSVESVGTLRVFDVHGRLVFEKPTRGFGDRLDEVWDGRTASGVRLPSGVYIVKVVIGAEALTTRFVLAQ